MNPIKQLLLEQRVGTNNEQPTLSQPGAPGSNYTGPQRTYDELAELYDTYTQQANTYNQSIPVAQQQAGQQQQRDQEIQEVYDAMRSSAESEFRALGLDPAQYRSAIDRELQTTMGSRAGFAPGGAAVLPYGDDTNPQNIWEAPQPYESGFQGNLQALDYDTARKAWESGNPLSNYLNGNFKHDIDISARRADQQNDFDTYYNQIVTDTWADLDQRNRDLQTQTGVQEPRSGWQGGSIDPTVDDVWQYFDPSFGQQVLGTAESQARDKYLTQARGALPLDIGDSRWTNDADDMLLESILGDMYEQNYNQLSNAQARGTINSRGYDAGTAMLDNQRTAGMSELQGIGDAILGGYRSNLNNIAGQAHTSAAGWTLGSDEFNPNTYVERLDNTYADQQGRLEGDLRSSVRGADFFDIGSVFNRAGQAQGVGNRVDSGILGALSEREDTRNQSRGLGTQGGF